MSVYLIAMASDQSIKTFMCRQFVRVVYNVSIYSTYN